RNDRRLCVLFHESHVLGGSLSVVRVLDHLASYGWTSTGWFPGRGPLLAESTGALTRQGVREKPIAFSIAGWRRPPGVGARLRRTPGYLHALRRWLLDVRPDVVHANSLLMLPEATVARALGLPVVVQVHELPSSGRKRDATTRWAAAVADVLIGVSTPVSEMLREHAGRTPVVTVHNGVPLAEPSSDAAHDGQFIVGSVGYVSRTKGTDVFLRAAEIVLRSRPDVRFEHVGEPRLWGDDEFDQEVDELAASPALRRAVTLVGRASVTEALARWNIFVLASRQEAFPLSSLEAMAAGLPVVATSVGGLPEQIAHLETGILVPAESPGAIAEWIVRLHDDGRLRSRLGEAARRQVRTNFTLQAQAEGLNEVYEKALRRRLAR
ncbi:MAG: glycosyltransferase family 4 protein, partial [Actinomycetota bacterium]|nr:glycosyltransferase family 4 protein [Actinomycetota bacterium]